MKKRKGRATQIGSGNFGMEDTVGISSAGKTATNFKWLFLIFFQPFQLLQFGADRKKA
ncbi:hypothetical protein [Parabacteroides pacaensis]|nr:hypothetical protein [Parabacteroides pacaensis]